MLFSCFTVSRGIATFIYTKTPFVVSGKDVVDSCINRSFTELIPRLDYSSVQLRYRVLRANVHVSTASIFVVIVIANLCVSFRFSHANKIKTKQIFVFKIILTDFLDIDFAIKTN